MHKKFFGVVAIFLVQWQTEAQTLTKTQLAISPEPNVYANVKWVDLDGDSDMDVVELYSDPNDDTKSFVKVYQNTNGSFNEQPNAFSVSSLDPRSYDFNDVDGDSDIDLLFLDNEGVKIAINNSDFTFVIQYTTISNPNNWHTEIHWKDLDQDQDLDIVFDMFIYMNEAGVYHPALHNMPFYTRNRSWADVNNDGYLDMVASKGQTNGVDPLFLFINQGDGLFKESKQLSSGFLDSGQTQWLDADADGDVDLFITEAGEKCTLFENTFSASGVADLQRKVSFKTLSNPKADVGDLNLDGFPDIIISGQGNLGFETYLYRNVSTSTELKFVEINLEIKPYYVSNFDVVDIDGDLDLDLFLLGWADGNYTVRAQDVYKINPGNTRPLPAVPNNLTTLVGELVTMSWSHNANQGAAFFDLAIDLDGVPFTSGLARNSGKLLMPDVLDFQAARQITLQNLPPGHYEWRVQAFDHAHRTSGFSESSAFTIVEAPNSLSLNVLAYNKVELIWQYTATATEFAILRRSTNGALVEIGTVPGNTLIFVDAAVPPNEHVEYVVKAVSNDSYSAPSATVSYYSAQFDELPFNPAGPNIITASGEAADFDQDQDYDMGFVGRIDDLYETSELLINNGSGTYSGGAFLPGSDVLAGPVVMKDVDNDGDIDVCAIIGNGSTGYKVAVYKNTGGSFTKAFETVAYQEISQLASEDMNYDGRPDLMMKRTVANSSGNPMTYALLYQDGSGNFVDSKVTFQNEISTIGALGDFYLADLSNDGFTDVIFRGVSNVKPKLFINQGGNAFKETTFGFASLTDPVFFDFNGDGKMDIIERGFQVLNFYNGLGSVQFGEPQEISIAGIGGNETIQSTIADMDFNGWPDLIVNDSHNTTLLYNSGGNFVRADYHFAANSGNHVFLTDMEGDGDLDLVKQGNDDYQQGINYYYKNRSILSPGQNVAPTAVSSPQVSRARNATTLSWLPATDDTTPSSMISYLVDLTDGNGKHWVHRETNAAGTFRRRLAYGNAGFRTSFTINDLPAGHYTANIQAVDATFKLSTSSTLTFDVVAGPSSLVTERVLLNKVKLTWTDGPVNGTATVIIRKSSNEDFQIIAELPANATSYSDEGLQYNDVYTYQVYEKVGANITTGSNIVNWNTALLALEQSNITNVTGSLDVGDYTADGKMDMLIFGGRLYNGNTVDVTSALLEKTLAGWAQQNAGSVAITNSGTSHFFDINEDHRIDLYQHGFSNPDSKFETNVFLNNGNKSFTETVNVFTSDYFEILETWDYDRDNDLDYYVMKPGVGTSLIRNDGSGLFSTDATFGACCADAVTPGDFDRDGDEDIIQFSQTSNYYTLSLNKDGAMRSNSNLSVSGGRMKKLDYNGDGWPDLLFIAGNGFNAKSKLYKNMGPNAGGAIQFKVIKDELPAGEVSVNTADYDHDGDLDIFFTGKSCVMYNNDGDDTFKESYIPNFSAGMNNTQWVDFDSDGDLDLFMMGYFTADYIEGADQPYGYLLKNQLIVAGTGIENLAPPAPINLTSYQDIEGLHLKWTAQPDDHTAVQALTHDVVIYKDGKEILKALVNPVTGARLKLQEGRASESLLVDNLEYGSYTWKVQAVDQTFTGSVFSTLAQFVFLPQAPLIKDTVIYKCDRQITLTAVGTDIEWYSDEGLTIKVASGTYSPQSSQKVYVTQRKEGMRGVARPVQITIQDRPAAPVASVNPYFYCESSSGTSASVAVSGKSVIWYKDADKKISAGAGNQLSIILAEQNYFVTQTIGQCESLPTVVAIKPLIIDSEIHFEDGKIYTDDQDGSFYQWYKNNSPLANSNNYILEGVSEGDTYKVYIEKGGCSETSAPTIITGIEDTEAGSIKIFPNPAHENFTIDLVRNITGFLRIYDASGRVVFEMTVEKNSDRSLLVPSAAWSNGMYFITITTGQNTISRKIVIK